MPYWINFLRDAFNGSSKSEMSYWAKSRRWWIVYDLVLIAGPCRSGTTFCFSTPYRIVTSLVFFQPLKHQIRCELSGTSSEMKFEHYVGNRIVIKEAFGPYSLEEAGYDPVQKAVDIFQAEKNFCSYLCYVRPQNVWHHGKKAFFIPIVRSMIECSTKPI
ncbi:hypothetical protein ACFS3C_12375 [Azotobacter vinelandii]